MIESNLSWRKSIQIPIISNNLINLNLNKFKDLLIKSIDCCVKLNLEKNNGVVCTTLSGGLDSSFCLSIIREIVGPDIEIHTFTTGGSLHHPDVQFAREISTLFNTTSHELIPNEIEKNNAKIDLLSFGGNKTPSLGDLAVYLTYKNINKNGFKSVIAHDGIDELLGGYWLHRKYKDEKMEEIFCDFWNRLEKEHLMLLEEKASKFEIKVIFPYLATSVVEYISKIPLSLRTSFEVSKIPLREIAKQYLPSSIIERKKIGFCSSLEK